MDLKHKKSWTKYIDFILLDIISLQLAFLFAYWIRHGMESNPYNISVYRNEALMMIILQLMMAMFDNNFKDIYRRGVYKEFVVTVKQVVFITLGSTFYLFVLKESMLYSRITLVLTGAFYFVLSYVARLLWKAVIRRYIARRENCKALILVTTSDKVAETMKTINDTDYHNYLISGLILLDVNKIGEVIEGVEVVADVDEAVNYVCRSWVDEIYIDVDRNYYLPQSMLDAFNEMGVTVHLKLQGLENPYHRIQYVEKMLGVTVMTYAVNDISTLGIFIKRSMDILGGLLGCILTLILTIIIGPIIKIKSPGPIFFTQIRVGKNGKCFKMYKFRSMYMDAEERKKELMMQNEVSDGMMFKIENDPRIIKGIGNFIRKTSLDEFPQFLNVLKGEMSLVGTRPPTTDEWVKYDLHHRLRMAMRPGITGMWQVSGRSDIKEFEEVVKLDAEYISKWNLGLDLKIIIKTIGVMIKGSGAS